MNHTIALFDLRIRRRAVIGYALGLAAYAFVIVAMYPAFRNDHSLDKLTESNPALMAALGVNGSLTSPAGWLNANLFNNFVPLILIMLAAGYGAWCVAGQDESGTLALQAGLPVSRRRLILDKGVALVAQTVPAVLLTFLCVLVGPSFSLHVEFAHLTETCVAALLLAVVFGAAAMLIGVLTGSRAVALSVSSGIAAAAFLISSLATTIEWLRPVRFLSPFYWATGNNPLENGLPIRSALALVITGAALLLVTMLAAGRTDLH